MCTDKAIQCGILGGKYTIVKLFQSGVRSAFQMCALCTEGSMVGTEGTVYPKSGLMRSSS